MITVFTQFGVEETSGLSALGVDGKAFLIQLVTFLLAFLVLKKWAFGPILKVLNERRETIENGVKLGEEMKQERAELDKKIEATLQDARKEAEGIIVASQNTAKEVAAEVEAKARTKADGFMKEAEGRIQQDTARARKQLEKELVGLISDATEAIIDEKVDAKKDAALIDKALKGRS